MDLSSLGEKIASNCSCISFRGEVEKSKRLSSSRGEERCFTLNPEALLQQLYSCCLCFVLYCRGLVGAERKVILQFLGMLLCTVHRYPDPSLSLEVQGQWRNEPG